jgi:hypothetical protein
MPYFCHASCGIKRDPGTVEEDQCSRSKYLRDRFRGLAHDACSTCNKLKRDHFGPSAFCFDPTLFATSGKNLFICCQCLTKYDCHEEFGSNYFMGEEACQQCLERNKRWIWIKSAIKGEEKPDWKRIDATTGDLFDKKYADCELTGIDHFNWQVTTIPSCVPLMCNLTVLKIGGCALLKQGMSEFPESLSSLVLLTELVLDECTLTQLPPWIDKYVQLAKLSLCDCPQLAKLPHENLVQITTLRSLRCVNCPLLWSPPKEVCSQGGEETINFLREAVSGGEFSHDLTIFLIGDGEAGKTSVISSLKSERGCAHHIRSDHRTIGLEVSTWEPLGMDVKYSIYDLAGQAVYSKTHQFFLLRRAVYVFVWRAIEGDLNMSDTVRYWLDSIQSRIPGSYLILVVTHIDQVQISTLNSLCQNVKSAVQSWLAEKRRAQALQDNPPSLLQVLNDGESMRVNCLSGEGVSELRSSLIRFTMSMPWYREALPKSWIRLRQVLDLERAKRGYLALDEYRRMAMDSCGVGEDMLACVTRFLHETGVIRFFGNFSLTQAGHQTMENPSHRSEPIKRNNSRKTSQKMASRAVAHETDDDHMAVSNAMMTTVYISTVWMMNVMKGLIRHERQALTDYFVNKGNKRMLWYINRLSIWGLLHRSLLPFLWPCRTESQEFWSFLRQKGARESELWSENVISNDEESHRAMALLGGFDLVLERGDEFLVPGVLPPSLLPETPLNMTKYCTSQILISFLTLPPSALDSIIVRIARSGLMLEQFDSVLAVFSNQEGHVVQLLTYRDESKKSHELLVRSSTTNLLRACKDIIRVVMRNFPGAVELSRVDDEGKDQDTPASSHLLWRPESSTAHTSNIACPTCKPDAGAYYFDRAECLHLWNSMIESDASVSTTDTAGERLHSKGSGSATVTCPSCARKHLVGELLGKFTVSEFRHCPICSDYTTWPEESYNLVFPGSFNAGECRLLLADTFCRPVNEDKLTVTCRHCLARRRLGRLRLRDVAPPEVFVCGWGLYSESQVLGLVQELIGTVELEADVVCDVRGLDLLRPVLDLLSSCAFNDEVLLRSGRIVQCAANDDVTIWKAASGEALYYRQGVRGGLDGVSVSNGGTFLAVRSSNGPGVEIWKENKLYHTLFDPDKFPQAWVLLRSGVFSKEAAPIKDKAPGSKPWDPDFPQMEESLPLAAIWAWNPAVSKEGRGIKEDVAAFGAGNTVVVYQVYQERAERLRGHTDQVLALAWNSKGDKLASVAKDKQLIVWSPEKSSVYTKKLYTSVMEAVAWSPGDKEVRLATYSRDENKVQIWDVKNRSASATVSWNGAGSMLHGLNWLSSNVLATTHDEETLVLWGCSDGQVRIITEDDYRIHLFELQAVVP